MKKNIVIFILISVLISSVFIAVADTNIVDSFDFQGEEIVLSIEKAREIVLQDNPTIKLQELDLDEAKVAYEKYESNIKDIKDKFKNVKKDSSSYLTNVKLVEVTGEYGLASAQRNYEAAVERVKAEIEQSYFSVLQAEKIMDINKLNLEIAKEIYEDTKKKFELGLVAKQEVLNSELNLISAENQYNVSTDSLKKAKIQFNIKLGNDIMTEFKLVDKLEYSEFEIGSIAEAVDKALISRNEIKAIEFAYEVEKINFDISSKKYPSHTYIYREKAIKLEKALKDIENTKKNIEMEVRNNYLDVLQKKEDIKSAEKSVELSEEVLRLTRLSYDVGMAVMTDVQNAQTKLLQAKLGLSQAILDYNLTILTYEDSISVGRSAMSSGSFY